MAMNDIIKKSETPTDTYWKTYKWHWARIKARMPGVNLCVYHLRHSFGSHMLKANKNLYNVKQAMGHTSIKTTERYMHVLDEDVRSDINNTEDLEI
jgi:site-specific recombinase XerD